VGVDYGLDKPFKELIIKVMAMHNIAKRYDTNYKQWYAIHTSIVLMVRLNQSVSGRCLDYEGTKSTFQVPVPKEKK